jgi:hypothetical protein
MEIAQHQMAELCFTAASEVADPFNELEVDAVFAAPDGSTRRIPGFWCGGREWRVRYTSGIVGRHTCVLHCRPATDAGLEGATGQVTVVPYEGDNPLYRHGPVRIAADRRHFAHDDGTPFFWLGDTWWMGLSRRLDWPAGFAQLASDRRAKGFTVIQIVAGLYPDMPAFDERGANEAGFPWEPGYARLRPEYFAMADRRLQYLVDEGFVPCLVGAWGYFAQWLGVERLKQHWRYLVARYGALPVVWCIAGEANLPYYLAPGFPFDDRQQVTQWTEVARYVHQLDPFGRPLSMHPTGLGRLTSRGAIDDESLLAFDMLQTGHGLRDVLPATVQTLRDSRAAVPTMPVLNSEVSYEGLMGTIPAEIQRLTFWTSLLSGAAGHTYGANGIWQVNRPGRPYGASPHGGNYGTTPWQEAMALPGSRQLAWARRLLCAYPWWRFEPCPEWASYEAGPADVPAYEVPYAAGVAGEVRFIYAPQNRTVVVSGLEPGVAYQALAYDPATGQQSMVGQALADGSGRWRCAPPAGIAADWLLVLAVAPAAAVEPV